MKKTILLVIVCVLTACLCAYASENKAFQYKANRIIYNNKTIDLEDYREKIKTLKGELEVIYKETVKILDGYTGYPLDKLPTDVVYTELFADRTFIFINEAFEVLRELRKLSKILELKDIIEQDKSSQNKYYYILSKEVHHFALFIDTYIYACDRTIKLIDNNRIVTTEKKLKNHALNLQKQFNDFDLYISKPEWIKERKDPSWYKVEEHKDIQ